MKINQCLKIAFSGTLPKEFIEDVIQKSAITLRIEGTVQSTSPTQITVIACGSRERIDNFLDILHKGVAGIKAQDIIVEPFLKAKDYRGAFRIIE
jgi:acylphosphatase